jgi:nucleoid DNA-binding protein
LANALAFPYNSASFVGGIHMEKHMAGAVKTRDDLAQDLAKRAEITVTAARDEVRWFFDTISETLEKGDEVRIHGFGAFKTAQRAARTGRNPRTGEAVKVPARRVVRFSPSTSLSTALKAGRTAARKR